MEVVVASSAMPPKFMEIRWTSKTFKNGRRGLSSLLIPGRKIPLYISTNPAHVNPYELRRLYSDCNHSCHRFPNLDADGQLAGEDSASIDRLRLALSHSAVLVSVFCSPQDVIETSKSEEEEEEGEERKMGLIEDVLRRVMLNVSPPNGRLVGFGRAVSDHGLTASIYDVTVIPGLRRMGIGQMIVKRIIRVLTDKDIYEIAALCSEKERFFFKACGFGDDILGSTTMMYTRSASTCANGDQMIKRAGRKPLVVPPLREPFSFSRPVES